MSVFLTAEWRKLVLANYAVDPELLRPRLPAGVELDMRSGTCYVSLVGFMFQNTRLKGIPVPFHTDFEEVNLRFYVKRNLPDGTVRRGVVFIRELVPKAAITLVANVIYKEPYATVPMRHSITNENGQLVVEYGFRLSGEHSFRVGTQTTSLPMEPGSEAEFITEHYWGYTKLDATTTSEYPVEHPRWEIYPVHQYRINVDFGKVYGPEFGFLTNEKPVSVMLAEGSKIVVKGGGKI